MLLSTGRCLARYPLAGDESTTCLITVAAPRRRAAAGSSYLDGITSEFPVILSVEQAMAEVEWIESHPREDTPSPGAQQVWSMGTLLTLPVKLPVKLPVNSVALLRTVSPFKCPSAHQALG